MPHSFQDLFGNWAQFDTPTDGASFSVAVANRVWDPVNLIWVSEVQSGGGSGSGGAVTVANGADTTEGFTTDNAIYGDNSGTLSAKLRGINSILVGRGSALAPGSASVTAVDSVVLAANANRKKCVIVNLGSVNVHFGDGQAAVLNSGITLTPNGTWRMSSYTFTTAAIHAICSSTATLAIQEYQ